MRARKICIAGTPVAVSAATIGYTCAKNQWAKLLGELANSGLGDACTQNVPVTLAVGGGVQLNIRCMDISMDSKCPPPPPSLVS